MVQRLGHPRRRRAVTMVFMAVLIPLILGLAALTLNLGYLHTDCASVQNTADSAAPAAASAKGSEAMVQVRQAREDDSIAIVCSLAERATYTAARRNPSLGLDHTAIDPNDGLRLGL